MQRPRGYVREHNPEAENVFKFGAIASAAETRDSRAGQAHSPAALELVHQLADVIRSRENHAAECEARAQALAQRALDELKLAEARLRSAEIARNAAEASVDDANGRMEEFARTFEHMEARMATSEIQLSEAFLRAKTAETRATEAEEGLVSVTAVMGRRQLQAAWGNKV